MSLICRVKNCGRACHGKKHQLCKSHYNQLQAGKFKNKPLRKYTELKIKLDK